MAATKAETKDALIQDDGCRHRGDLRIGDRRLGDRSAGDRRGSPGFEPAAEPRGRSNVDVELVIAVDVSYSMDPDEQALQREGYITGLT